MDPFLPLDPLLTIPDSLTFLNPSTSTSTAPSATAAAPAADQASSGLQSFDSFYSDWINSNPTSSQSAPSAGAAAAAVLAAQAQAAAGVHANTQPSPATNPSTSAGDSTDKGKASEALTAAGLPSFDGNELLAHLLAQNPPPPPHDGDPSRPAPQVNGAITETDAEALAKFLAQATAANEAALAASKSSEASSASTAAAAIPTQDQPIAGVKPMEVQGVPQPPPRSTSAPVFKRQGKIVPAPTGSGSSPHHGANHANSSMPPPPPPGHASRTNSHNLQTTTPSPSPRDESVPEAALHLLRLALPTGANGSVSNNSSRDADGVEHQEGGDDSMQIGVPVHNDDQSASEVWQNLERRTSGRVRKSVIQDTKALFDDESSEDDMGSDGDHDGHSDSGKKGRSRGMRRSSTASSSVAGSTSTATSSTKGKSTARGRGKRASTASGLPASNKKPRTSVSSATSSAIATASQAGGLSAPRRPRRSAAPVTVPNRVFPYGVDIDAVQFPRFYRQFPVSTAFPPDSYVHRFPALATIDIMAVPGDGAKWNKAHDPLNLYAPKFVKGLSDEKAGLCPICVESVDRGGEGVERWLKLKNSSYVYHMSYAHGLSNLTGLPFSPPKKLRTKTVVAPTKDARDHMTEGLCHKCDKWIPLLSVKNVEAVVPELIWWKHAKPCHGNTAIEGEGEYFCEDDVYRLVATCKNALTPNSAPIVPTPASHNGTPQPSYSLPSPSFEGSPVASTSTSGSNGFP